MQSGHRASRLRTRIHTSRAARARLHKHRRRRRRQHSSTIARALQSVRHCGVVDPEAQQSCARSCCNVRGNCSAHGKKETNGIRPSSFHTARDENTRTLAVLHAHTHKAGSHLCAAASGMGRGHTYTSLLLGFVVCAGRATRTLAACCLLGLLLLRHTLSSYTRAPTARDLHLMHRLAS